MLRSANLATGAKDFHASNGPVCTTPVCPQTDVSARKMLRYAQMAAMTGRTAAT
jgi:hypothetical protein